MQTAQKKRRKFILGVVVITSVIGGLAAMQLSENTVYFYTPAEAVLGAEKLSKETIRLAGMVEGGSINWQPATLDLQFRVSDFKGVVILVTYKGTPPDMFKENSGVVVEGRLSPDGSSFIASTIMAKHSEEYKVPDKMSQSMDTELLRKSIIK